MRSIADIKSLPLDDEVRIQTDDAENPKGLVETYSTDTLEEDVANMELSGKYVLSEELRRETIKTATVKVLQEIGPYIPKEKLQLLFPGINLDSLVDYDIENSRLRFYILPDEDYRIFHGLLNASTKPSGSGGFTSVGVRPAQYPLVDTITTVNMGEKRIIVVAEGDPSNSYIGPIPASEKITKQLQAELEAKLVHEIIHNFDVAEGLPKKMKEGIVEWYTQGIARGDITNENYYEKSDIPLAYYYDTEAVSYMLTAMLENGVELDTIYKAFISGDKSAGVELSAFLVKRYGIEEATKILEWQYKNGRQALSHIISLEAVQDSRLGKFLRDFGNRSL